MMIVETGLMSKAAVSDIRLTYLLQNIIFVQKLRTATGQFTGI